MLVYCLVILCLIALARASDVPAAEQAVAVDGTAQPKAEAKTQRSKTGINNKRFKVEELEKEWEKGDAEEELEHEFEINRRVGARVTGKKLDLNDPMKIQKLFKEDPLASAGLSGNSVMMFADLKDKQPNGKPWTKEMIDHTAGKWASLLRTGSMSCQIYSIGENVDDPKFLLSIDKGWTTSEIIRFALQQPETKKLTKDNRDYLPETYNFDEDEDE